MNIGDKIKRARENAGLRQKELANLVGITGKGDGQGVISNYENSRREPSLAVLTRIAGVVGLTLTELLNYGDDPEIKPNMNVIGKIPLVRWPDITKGNTQQYAKEWLPCPVRCGKLTYATTVRDDTMQATRGTRSYPLGTIIYIDPGQTPKAGDAVIEQSADAPPTFKILKLDGAQRYLMPLNEQYNARVMSADDRILGVCIAALHPENKQQWL